MAGFNLYTDPTTLVTVGMLNSFNKGEIANAKLTQQLDYLQDVLAQITNLPAITGAILPPIVNQVDPYIVQVKPDRAVIDAVYPNAPPDAVLGAVADLVIDDVPVLSTAEPVFNPVAPPTKFTKSAPVATAIPDRTFPDAPGYTLPTVPVARVLTLPTAPSLLTVNFEGILPTALASPPNVDFVFTEQDYQSMLLDGLNDKLLNLVLNTQQTGLSPAIEQQIWDRGRERTAAVTQGAIDNIDRMFARSGWTLPQGDQVRSIYKAQEQQTAEDIAESRSIAIAQADLEQKNFQFAFTQALGLETQLINLHNSTQQRAFDAAKYLIEAAISLYQVQVAYFNGNVTLYTAQAQVYRDRIQGELVKLEIYKTELEGQKLINELNAQDVVRYTAQIEAVVAIFGLYKDELEAVKIQIEADGLKVQQFEANIRAFAEEIHAKALEYDGYKTELSGEEIKATTYKAVVEGFGKRIDAFTSVTDARVKKLDSDIKVNIDTPLKILAQQTEVYKTQTQAKTAEIEGLTTIYKTDAEVYDISVKGEGTRINAQVSVQEAEINYNTKQAELAIEVAKANITTMLAQKELSIGTIKAIAQLLSQLVAAYGSTVNLSAGISGTGHVSDTVSHSTSHNSIFPHAESSSTE